MHALLALRSSHSQADPALPQQALQLSTQPCLNPAACKPHTAVHLQLEGLKAFVESDLRWRPHTAQLLKHSIVRQIQANCKLREVVEILLQCAYGSKVLLILVLFKLCILGTHVAQQGSSLAGHGCSAGVRALLPHRRWSVWPSRKHWA